MKNIASILGNTVVGLVMVAGAAIVATLGAGHLMNAGHDTKELFSKK